MAVECLSEGLTAFIKELKESPLGDKESHQPVFEVV